MLEYIDSTQFKNDYRKYLEDNGISNAHVARCMDISPQQLQNVFKKQELTINDIQRLCNAINMQCNVTIIYQPWNKVES